MFKHVMTLLRGVAHQSGETFIDRNALPLLQQQIREAGETVRAAQKSVAIAVAQNKQEMDQHQRLLSRLADMEVRAIAALEQNETALAHEAAEVIALMETEQETSELAQAQFSAEVTRLKHNVHTAEARLRALKRGERVAVATDRTQRLHDLVPGQNHSTLSDAENTLTRLRERQMQIDLTAEALEEMDSAQNPARIVEKLAAAGCGQPLKSSAEDVLSRLKSKSRAPLETGTDNR
ncbi:MAG: PspA/IM30 family protein [Stappiaceae bacterium]